MNAERILYLVTKPAWPRSLDLVGWPLFVLAAAALVALTFWAYYGTPQATRKRIGVLGNRGFMPEYRRAHVTASRVTPLEERLVR